MVKDKELSSYKEQLAERDLTIRALNDEINTYKQRYKVSYLFNYCRHLSDPFCDELNR